MNGSLTTTSADAIREEYSNRQQTFESSAASFSQRSRWALATCLGCIAPLALPLLLHTTSTVAIPAVSTGIALWQLRTFLRLHRQAIEAARRAAFYGRGIDRIDGCWQGQGNAGIEFARDHHPYQDDLDILGNGSLFELLATTRSDAGAERLAAYLLEPVTLSEARARQEAVKELRPGIELREEIDVLGKHRFRDCNRRRLRKWLDQPLLCPPTVVPVLLGFLSLFTFTLVAIGFVRLYPWFRLAPELIFSLASQGAISLAFMRQVRARIEVLRTLSGNVSVLHAGIELIAQSRFQSTKLRAIAECLSAEDVGSTLRKLERLLRAIESREDAILYGFLVWIAAGTQLVLAIERWRIRHHAKFENLLDAWADFEALSALAGYAYENPNNTFPALIDGRANFEARQMGHPLLSDRTCVRNDISLDDSTRFYIVSGSNMAGKSTLLRAIGLNSILASAGAPVRAKQGRIAVMSVCASIAIRDSLRDGASKFFAEVERIRNSIQKAAQGERVLFLIDEMLAGTNSRDRATAAEWMLEALITAGAVGVLSTHDLALTEIAKQEALRGANVHMQSKSQDDPLDFDFRLRPGIASQTNGLAIVRMMGMQI